MPEGLQTHPAGEEGNPLCQKKLARPPPPPRKIGSSTLASLAPEPPGRVGSVRRSVNPKRGPRPVARTPRPPPRKWNRRFPPPMSRRAAWGPASPSPPPPRRNGGCHPMGAGPPPPPPPNSPPFPPEQTGGYGFPQNDERPYRGVCPPGPPRPATPCPDLFRTRRGLSVGASSPVGDLPKPGQPRAVPSEIGCPWGPFLGAPLPFLKPYGPGFPPLGLVFPFPCISGPWPRGTRQKNFPLADAPPLPSSLSKKTQRPLSPPPGVCRRPPPGAAPLGFRPRGQPGKIRAPWQAPKMNL